MVIIILMIVPLVLGHIFWPCFLHQIYLHFLLPACSFSLFLTTGQLVENSLLNPYNKKCKKYKEGVTFQFDVEIRQLEDFFAQSTCR